MSAYRDLCIKFVERAEALNLKGKKRDDAALEFMIGAATALDLADHPEATHVRSATVLLVVVRGYAEVAVTASNK